jgi:hypothetical protein
MIYEERTYTIVTGRIDEYMKNYEELGLPVQFEVLGTLVGFSKTDLIVEQENRVWSPASFSPLK